MNDNMANSSALNNYSYFTDPTYQDIRFAIPIQIYFIIFGILATLLNLYPIFLFVKFRKLRNTTCNWMIIFQCISELLIGYGIFMRGVTYLYSINSTIMDFNLIFCTLVGGFCSSGYRVGQIIALLMASDRFLAIWKPKLYARRQENNAILINVIISIFGFMAIMFIYVYGIILYDAPLDLYYCLYFTGVLYEKVIPIYSCVVTIAFFITYISSLVLFFNYISSTMKQQAHARAEMSKQQKKIFISVSCVLLCYTVFYVFPSTLQILQRYFGLTGSFINSSGYIIQFGSVFNACLNAIIYLATHIEFKECSKHLVYGLLNKLKSTTTAYGSTTVAVKPLTSR